MCALDWSNFSFLVGGYYLGRIEDLYNDWRKGTPVLRWETIHSDAESMYEFYPLFLVYYDTGAGLDTVNHRRTPDLRLLGLPKRFI